MAHHSRLVAWALLGTACVFPYACGSSGGNQAPSDAGTGGDGSTGSSSGGASSSSSSGVGSSSSSGGQGRGAHHGAAAA
jgi:hypothetical protein